MGEPIDRAGLVQQLRSQLAPSAADGPLDALLHDLVDDWAREADPMPDPMAVVRFQRDDLEQAVESVGGDPVDGVRAALLRRRIDHVGAATLRAARRRLDGEAGRTPDEARALLAEVEQLADDVDALRGHAGAAATADELRARLQDPMLEARYAVDGGAMSFRLAREQPGEGSRTADPPGAGGPPGPPDVRPA
ncbi:MAG TPA: hypothetical protein VHN98_08815 [Acidimicrobiales bacterium]|nr:hypothetical protein [Acidimicrobiales bacterium]